MNSLDIIVLFGVALAVAGGYRLGFLTRAFSWIAMAVGAYIGLRLLPVVAPRISHFTPITRLGIVVFVIFMLSAIFQVGGIYVGTHIAKFVPHGPLRKLDRLAGAVVGAIGVLLLLWLLLPAVANTPGMASQIARTSWVATHVYDSAPTPPNIALTLRHLTNDSAFPTVFEGLQRAPEVQPAPTSITLDENVISRVTRSTVKVEGIACKRSQNGSGFVVEDHLVATNAHVVAGEKHTQVMTTQGNYLDATVVYFNAARDIALLSVPRLDAPALPTARAVVGSQGASFGHPGGQNELAITPVLINQRITAIGRDLYDQKTTHRNVLVLASNLHQGDSGSAIVNPSGQVIGVAFAIAPDRPGVAYGLDIDELRASLDEPRTGAVPTGECLAG